MLPQAEGQNPTALLLARFVTRHRVWLASERCLGFISFAAQNLLALARVANKRKLPESIFRYLGSPGARYPNTGWLNILYKAVFHGYLQHRMLGYLHHQRYSELLAGRSTPKDSSQATPRRIVNQSATVIEQGSR